uniref:Uncharacterized protein n=1 Tax=Chromera velia CCMP2878 TaxID=1169474 RepID=A0A0G4FAP0_9ALVE|eukprot:Cvel_3037.t1-p1 / transcript=Cvel_3037.t1 / gene=Cvel_3037 / organism=Chromera_velia_CCMP2878 / gene_product=hypothetical protein / transcript_product=hypothetical protein / location=Cvel_scaffold121:70510-73590(+) / protein_length=1027 / sequence_SO=supercontig / SO=protein_coding / is_pseudo=false
MTGASPLSTEVSERGGGDGLSPLHLPVELQQSGRGRVPAPCWAPTRAFTGASASGGSPSCSRSASDGTSGVPPGVPGGLGRCCCVSCTERSPSSRHSGCHFGLGGFGALQGCSNNEEDRCGVGDATRTGSTVTGGTVRGDATGRGSFFGGVVIGAGGFGIERQGSGGSRDRESREEGEGRSECGVVRLASGGTTGLSCSSRAAALCLDDAVPLSLAPCSNGSGFQQPVGMETGVTWTDAMQQQGLPFPLSRPMPPCSATRRRTERVDYDMSAGVGRMTLGHQPRVSPVQQQALTDPSALASIFAFLGPSRYLFCAGVCREWKLRYTETARSFRRSPSPSRGSFASPPSASQQSASSMINSSHSGREGGEGDGERIQPTQTFARTSISVACESLSLLRWASLDEIMSKFPVALGALPAAAGRGDGDGMESGSSSSSSSPSVSERECRSSVVLYCSAKGGGSDDVLRYVLYWALHAPTEGGPEGPGRGGGQRTVMPGSIPACMFFRSLCRGTARWGRVDLLPILFSEVTAALLGPLGVSVQLSGTFFDMVYAAAGNGQESALEWLLACVPCVEESSGSSSSSTPSEDTFGFSCPDVRGDPQDRGARSLRSALQQLCTPADIRQMLQRALETACERLHVRAACVILRTTASDAVAQRDSASPRQHHPRTNSDFFETPPISPAPSPSLAHDSSVGTLPRKKAEGLADLCPLYRDGRLDVGLLSSLVERELPIDSGGLAGAVGGYGDVEMAGVMADLGLLSDQEAQRRLINEACKNGRTALLREVGSWGPEWASRLSSRSLCNRAAEGGHLETLIFLREERGAPWDHLVTFWAFERGHWGVLRYAWERGCPLDDGTAARLAAMAGWALGPVPLSAPSLALPGGLGVHGWGVSPMMHGGAVQPQPQPQQPGVVPSVPPNIAGVHGWGMAGALGVPGFGWGIGPVAVPGLGWGLGPVGGPGMAAWGVGPVGGAAVAAAGGGGALETVAGGQVVLQPPGIEVNLNPSADHVGQQNLNPSAPPTTMQRESERNQMY